MKKLLILAAQLLCFLCLVHAQSIPMYTQYPVMGTPGATFAQIMDSLTIHADATDTGEGGIQDQLKSFDYFWQARVNVNDSSGLNMFQEYTQALGSVIAARTSGTLVCGGIGFTGAWEQAGPNNLPTENLGYVGAIWAGSNTDSNLMYAGTAYSYFSLGNGTLFGSGLFKSSDGGGHWANVTDNIAIDGIIAVNSIAVNPLNYNTVFVATGTTRLLESFDGGVTWQQETVATGASNVDKIYFTSDSVRLYAIVGASIYTRLNVGTSNPWVEITPPSVGTTQWEDIVFVPGTRNDIFVSNAGNTGIWETKDSLAGTGWTQITSGFSDVIGGSHSVAASAWTIMRLSVPDADTLFFIAMSDDARYSSLYKYNITGATHAITRVYDKLPYFRNPSGGKFNIIVSPASISNNGNRRNVYYGADVPYHSYDGGNSFMQIGRYWGDNTHADIRGMCLANATNTLRGTGDRLLLANDGGVSMRAAGVDDSVAESYATVDASGTGLAVGTYFSFATSEAVDGGMGGMQHDGLMAYEASKTPQWKTVYDDDSYFCAADKTKQVCYGYNGVSSTFAYLCETEPGSGRNLNTVDEVPDGGYSSFPQPEETSFVGDHIETDNFGGIYCVHNSLMRKRATDPNFVLTQDYSGTPWGFPDNPTVSGEWITLNPNDTTFEGYVLYNNNDIYYRNYSIPAYMTAGLTGSVPASGTYSINGVITDPNNTARVWVCQAGVHPRGYYRVQYSDDYGADWVDVSNGLPNIAVTCLVYDETDSTLYCSTDAGIYTCNFSHYDAGSTFPNLDGESENTSVPWTCFNTGLVAGKNFPNVPVTDLRINHCQGKLYAATHCRSIWSTDLNPPGTQVGTTDVISSNTTWPSLKKYMTGSIDIQAGATLTLSGDSLFMPKNGLIIVEPGGKLVVANSVITNGCGGCLWKGIQARGQTYMPQTPANQGWVVMTNSVIANADTGVANCNTSAFWGSTGGIIQCTNTTFLNCHNSATFYVYDNWNTAMTVLSPNLSYFMHCNFIINPDYRNPTAYSGYYMQNMVVLRGVEGIPFQGCGMYNRLGTGTGGTGINAWNAGFSVLPWCSSGTITPGGCTGASVPPVFHGLSNGVLVDGALGWDPGVSVDFAEFDSTSIGVNVHTTHVSTTRSTFVVGTGDPVDSLPGVTPEGCGTNIGILTQNTPLFRIEGNSFMGRQPAIRPTVNWIRFGTVVTNLGFNEQVVYRNSYDSLDGGVVAVGADAGEEGGSLPHTLGLRISCNNFMDNQSDIAVAAGGSIGPDQNEEVSAGNQFLGGSVDNINNDGSPITYYFYAAIEAPAVCCVGTGGVGVTPTRYMADCSPTFGGVSGGDAEIPVTVRGAMNQGGLAWFKQDFYTSAASLADSQTLYNSRVDFGNTDSLIGVIHASTDTAVLYSTLSGGAPYISAAALTVAADSGKEPYYSMMQLAKQNPDDNRDYSFFSRMQADFTLSALDVDSLMAWAALTTTRTNLSAAIGSLTKQNAKDANLIMMALKAATDTNVNVADSTGTGICMDSTSVYYRLDSNSYYAGFDSIDVWLKNIGGIWTSYKRVGYYNFLNQPMTADAIFTNIAGEVGASPTRAQDSTVYATYTPLWHTVRNADLAGRNVYLLNNGELAGLDTFSTHSAGFCACMTIRVGVWSKIRNAAGGFAGEPKGSFPPQGAAWKAWGRGRLCATAETPSCTCL